ncbi:coproporphyrinogen III oxidase [Clostridium sediminicola]|uniref:coproporphyrinogen III oxidase n=1 Tax=Clostridium sediminicola TaxID=3114879 RepID=UPI0031F215FE
MIKVALNDMNYRFAIYQILNMYYQFEKIEFTDKDYYYKFIIHKGKLEIYLEENMEVEYFLNEENEKEELKRVLFEYLKMKSEKILPWGILSGIRPTKQIHKIINNYKDKETIIKIFMDKYLTSLEKAELCYETALIEKNIVNKEQNNISIYIGMPFCPTRCTYCSFTSNPIAKCKKLVNPYIEALMREIDEISKFISDKNLKIQNVYFGGGTPTSVDEENFSYLMDKIFVSFIQNKNIQEFNVECGRPDSITEEKLLIMKKYGVNRISINPQTMNDETLKKIGRNHNTKDVIEKFHLARKCGFSNINMDLIIGLPGEKIEHVKKTVNEIKKLNPDNITVHGMSIKRASKLHENLLNGKFKLEEQNNLNQMFDLTRTLSNELSMHPYYLYRQKNMVGNMENLGYSKIGKEGIYNIQIIEEKQTIIALGADAVTKIVHLEEDRIDRVANLKDVREYISRIEEKIKVKIGKLEKLYN